MEKNSIQSQEITNKVKYVFGIHTWQPYIKQLIANYEVSRCIYCRHRRLNYPDNTMIYYDSTSNRYDREDYNWKS